MSGVEGRVALVTGAGRGIGKARVAAAGRARCARDGRLAQQERADRAWASTIWLPIWATPGGCAQAVAETERRLGPVDILVCNHGIGSAHERVIWEQDIEVWDETMRINLDGPFHLSRLIVGGMADRGYGRVVYTARPPASWRSGRAARTARPSTG